MAEQTQLLAFDRQNHMGVSSDSAASLSAAIREEAEALLSDKRVVGTDVAISQNKDKIKVCLFGLLLDQSRHEAVSHNKVQTSASNLALTDQHAVHKLQVSKL